MISILRRIFLRAEVILFFGLSVGIGYQNKSKTVSISGIRYPKTTRYRTPGKIYISSLVIIMIIFLQVSEFPRDTINLLSDTDADTDTDTDTDTVHN